jgi:hypothetical protein
MNKVGNAMTFSGLLLAALSLFSLSAPYFEPRWAVLGSSADEALTISAILVLIAVLLRFSPNSSTQRVLPRQLRILFWIGAVLMLAYQAPKSPIAYRVRQIRRSSRNFRSFTIKTLCSIRTFSACSRYNFRPTTG